MPGAPTRTDIGVGEDVNLTAIRRMGIMPIPVSAAWSTTAGTLSTASGATSLLTAPDTKQTITVTAGPVTKDFNVIAPTSVVMDRQPSTGVKHTKDQPDSGIQTRVFLGPDTVSFYGARYREMDVNATATGTYSCFAAGTPHCGAGAGSPCPDKALTDTVVAGMGTQSLLGDCAYSGACGTPPPHVDGSISFIVPYQYKVGAGAFRWFVNVAQQHISAAGGVILTTSKAGAVGVTSADAATVTIPSCP
jgi:hypothetical protein